MLNIISGTCVCTTHPICRDAALSVKIVRLLRFKKYEEAIKAFE